MCGIVGIIQSKPVKKSILSDMTREIAHRGPDSEGFYLDRNVGLGHRRLAIIDLSPAGHQPMFNEDKSIAIVFNGEIYNFQKIKKELEKKKHTFKSGSDTEVIIHAYEEWGKECVHKFNGMWAFIIYDRKKRSFFVSRDRLGIKPLYYYYDREKLICASEIKAILKYPGIKAKLNPNALNEYFTFQNILSHQTLFENIYLLEAGNNLIYSDGKLENIKYWDADFEKKDLTIGQWKEKLFETLKESVWRHLISDVPVGTLLSGGMDSTTISYFASQKNPKFMTFSGGFDLEGTNERESSLDERKYAEIVARTVSSEHYENVLHPINVKLAMPKIIWHLEDLRLGMCYPQYYIAKLASKFVKVALSGTGGDEIFGGYPWRYQLIAKSKTIEDFDFNQYNYWSRLIKDDQKINFFSDSILEKIDLGNPFSEYRNIISPADEQDPVDKAIYFEQKTFLHGFFIVEDKMLMAHSIEGRVPMTDFELIKLANSIPAKLKYKDNLGKVLFRKTMNKYLPREITTKRKTGFTPPDETWYRYQLNEYMREIIVGKRALARGYFNREYLKRVFFEHEKGKKDHRLLLWSLLSFEWWNRIFLEGEGHDL
ncbi:MAG: putative asparagine synthetase [Candidatus Berkelbacteria bacterium]|nr:putative asparagine synthetase [Candidatus Berkelbacteria bacterium]